VRLAVEAPVTGMIPSIGWACESEEVALHASREVVFRTERYVPLRPWLLGSPQVPVERLFPCAATGLAQRPSPCSRTNRFHSPIG